MTKITLILATMLAFTTASAQAQLYRVIGISDGDTIKVLSADKQQIKCRLFGIDAPESRQSFGQASKNSLSDMVFGKDVKVEILDQDQYGRSVCRIILNGVDVNKVQLQRGFAWFYARYSDDVSYAAAERTARQQKLGLWSEPNQTPPWFFRRNQKAVN
jgi:micrococcal nuclease